MRTVAYLVRHACRGSAWADGKGEREETLRLGFLHPIIPRALRLNWGRQTFSRSKRMST